MILHLLFTLMDRGERPEGTRLEKRGKIVLDCPHCQAAGVAVQFAQFKREAGVRNPWQLEHYLYECSACHRQMNADAFQNDGTGVMKVKTWDCPQCRAINHGLRSSCEVCGKSLI